MRQIYAFLGGFGHFWTLWVVHGRTPIAQSKVGPVQVRPWADLDAMRMSMDGFWRGLVVPWAMEGSPDAPCGPRLPFIILSLFSYGSCLSLIKAVRDIHETYRMNGDWICGTNTVHMRSPEREEACSFCLLALRLVSSVDYSCS